MADDLRDQIAEALKERLMMAKADTAVPSFGGTVGHLLAATPHDLADVALAILGPKLERHRAEAKQWHDTYQQHANDVDEFLGVLLELLPGAEDTGSDAYDQIPRGIEALRAELARAQEETRVVRLLAEEETARAAYEAMDAERRMWESRRAVDNVTFADLRREIEALRSELAARLRRKALGRSLLEMKAFAQRESARADRAEAAVMRVRVARANAQSSMGRVYDYVKGSDLDAALDTLTPTEETDRG